MPGRLWPSEMLIKRSRPTDSLIWSLLTGNLAAQGLAFRPGLAAQGALLFDVLLDVSRGALPQEAAKQEGGHRRSRWVRILYC